MQGLSVIVLTWNGYDLIKECFPSLIAISKACTIPYEIIVVDNGSTDGTVSYIRETWPEVRVLTLKRNYGFSYANNYAAREAQYDTLLFLNNDIVLSENFLEPLIARMCESRVFAVAPLMYRWDRVTIDDGLRYAQFSRGLFEVHLETDSAKIREPHYITFFCGACFICKRDIFFHLGGFDELFTPYAWEDLDLAYRAWKQGYTVLYEPTAVCYHKREATTGELFGTLFRISLVWRNRFFFTWKNITDAQYFIDHLIRLPWKLIKFLFTGRWRYVIGFIRALPYVPVVFMRRRREKKRSVLNDAAVIEQSYRELLCH